MILISWQIGLGLVWGTSYNRSGMQPQYILLLSLIIFVIHFACTRSHCGRCCSHSQILTSTYTLLPMMAYQTLVPINQDTFCFIRTGSSFSTTWRQQGRKFSVSSVNYQLCHYISARLLSMEIWTGWELATQLLISPDTILYKSIGNIVPRAYKIYVTCNTTRDPSLKTKK